MGGWYDMQQLHSVVVAASVGLVCLGSSACATKPMTMASHPCRIVGPAKLPKRQVTAAGLCAAIDRAIAANASGSHASVEVKIPSPHTLIATIRMAGGRVLPEKRMDVSDGVLTSERVERFAAAVASDVANARDR